MGWIDLVIYFNVCNSPNRVLGKEKFGKVAQKDVKFGKNGRNQGGQLVINNFDRIFMKILL